MEYWNTGIIYTWFSMHSRTISIACLCLLLSACGPVYRDLDPAPIQSVLEEGTLPPGTAEMAIVWDTSGDQMSLQKWMIGLRVVVHYQNVFVHQMFANCAEAGSDELQEVQCDDRLFRITADMQAVRIEEVKDGGVILILSTIKIPSDVRSVTYSRDLSTQFYYSAGRKAAHYEELPPDLQNFSEKNSIPER